MPCGRSVIFDDAEHIMGLGIEDISCLCGNPKHYMVRFVDARVEVNKGSPKEHKILTSSDEVESIVLKPGQYFCSKCESPHRENSKVGVRHLKHNVE